MSNPANPAALDRDDDGLAITCDCPIHALAAGGLAALAAMIGTVIVVPVRRRRTA